MGLLRAATEALMSLEERGRGKTLRKVQSGLSQFENRVFDRLSICLFHRKVFSSLGLNLVFYVYSTENSSDLVPPLDE